MTSDSSKHLSPSSRPPRGYICADNRCAHDYMLHDHTRGIGCLALVFSSCCGWVLCGCMRYHAEHERQSAS